MEHSELFSLNEILQPADPLSADFEIIFPCFRVFFSPADDGQP